MKQAVIGSDPFIHLYRAYLFLIRKQEMFGRELYAIVI